MMLSAARLTLRMRLLLGGLLLLLLLLLLILLLRPVVLPSLLVVDDVGVNGVDDNLIGAATGTSTGNSGRGRGIATLLSAGSSSNNNSNSNKNSNKVLNVHVVAHTHDDVGWLKTVDQYYSGLNNTIQSACVEDILDSVVSSLLEDPDRTFTYVEQKFFSMWWRQQGQDQHPQEGDAMKDAVRFLVANQQLSFVNGGWCMHDEAAAHFMGMIDQTTLGHRFLRQELGVLPTVGWQLDPFGHSASQASLFTSKMGFDAVYLGRIDYQDLNKRHYEKGCEGLWNSNQNHNQNQNSHYSHNNLPQEDTTVFWGLTGSYEGNYGAPQGYCFDIGCEDPLLVDMDQRQLERAMHGLLEKIRVQSDRTQGNHIMLTMGSDFQYQRAHVNFANLDLMISTISEMQRLNQVDIPAMFGPRFDQVHMFYSSPNYYTQCKHEEFLQFQQQQKEAASSSSSSEDATTTNSNSNNSNMYYAVKTDDFMPYSDCEHCFWTGYFTSRSGLKKLERVSSSFLLAARQIESIALLSEQQQQQQQQQENCQQSLAILEDASGVAQHHDGVSGTSKQHVANDYAKRLQLGIDRVASTCTIPKLRRLFFGATNTTTEDDESSSVLLDLAYCQLLNETKCDVSQEATKQNGTDVYVMVYNGLAQSRSSIVHLPVSSKAMYSVEEISGGGGGGGHHYGHNRSTSGASHTQRAVVLVPAIPATGTPPLHNTNDGIAKLLAGDASSSRGAPYKIVFQAANVPPLGASVYKVSMEDGNAAGNPVASRAPPKETKHTLSHSPRPNITELRTSRRLLLDEEEHNEESDDVVASNEYFSVTFEGSSGRLKSMTVQNVSMDLENDWGYYTSFDSKYDAPDKPDDNPSSRESQNSGAYIFRPSSSDQKPILVKQISSTVYNTTVGVEVHAIFDVPWIKTVTRVMLGQPYLEMEYTIGPIPIDDGRGKEVISRLRGPIQNDGTFYTDSNGREFMERKRNYRPTWDLNVYEPVAGNYYPVNAAIYIEDRGGSGKALAVATDRSQGGASIQDGSLELMVQRRTLADDFRGVNEPLNETDSGITPYPPYGNATRLGNGVVIKGKQYILIGTKGGATLARSMMDQAFVEPMVFVGSAPSETKPNFTSSHIVGIKERIPPNVMLITRSLLNDEKNETTSKVVLLRLGHQYGVGEDAILSKPVEVNLTSFLLGYDIVDVLETTLSANQGYEAWQEKRLKWTATAGAEQNDKNSHRNERRIQGSTIKLEPMDIRTFLITVK